MQGFHPWTDSFSTEEKEAKSVNELNVESEQNKLGVEASLNKDNPDYLSLSPSHGSWNVEETATIETSPTTGTRRGPLDSMTLS